ncbi:MAG: bacteriohemerythrin [Holophagaceae bacterium]|uniref:Bacteriohemerythrin n=1 Tax=Candidatus Geothrix skivensis TaxID=2954439 RepID=A0A9D7XJ86_9BACT|nr:bacteriohemerythrin [Candidatus Geothrix skivensis]
MAQIQWKDRYNISFREIDAQHHGLLDLLNELSDQMDGQKHPGSVAHIFAALGDYARTHFSTEERYMQAADYPKLAQHRQEHAAFVTRVQELSRAYEPGDPHLAEETSAFLRDWYLNHITKSDQDYVPHLKRALPTASIEAVLFGLEGVVCTLDPAPLLQAFCDTSGKPEAEVQGALWEDPGLLRELEAGQWDLERFGAEGARWAGQPLDLAALAATYAASFSPVTAMLRLAAQLKQHQPVGLVGNATPWLRTQGLVSLGLEGHFSAEALSCEAGLRLPDKGLFLAAAERLGLAPDTCLLIHRDPACLDAAQAARMQTLDYTTPVMLMAQLRRMGVPF